MSIHLTPEEQGPSPKSRKTKGNGPIQEDQETSNVTPLPPSANTAQPRVSPEEHAALDEYEKLANDALLDDDEGDAPGDKDEIVRPLIAKKLPRFAVFRASPVTFDLWGLPTNKEWTTFSSSPPKALRLTSKKTLSCAV